MTINPFLFLGQVGIVNYSVMLVAGASRGKGGESGGRLGKTSLAGSIMGVGTLGAGKDSSTPLAFTLQRLGLAFIIMFLLIH